MHIGGRSGSPFGPVPSSKTLSACSSVKLGNPARAGARSAQFAIGATGRIQIAAPRSHAASSSPPSAFRGVWHSGHFAISSTKYRPRSISFFVGGAGSANRFWNACDDPAIKAVITTTHTNTSLSRAFMSPRFTPWSRESAKSAVNRLSSWRNPSWMVGVSQANPVFRGPPREFSCSGNSMQAEF
jgi:hypothetical protein